jgi:energy-coupling factor transporter ATP-binding protein EcfA2
MTLSRPLRNPFPGLRPFEANETHLFFGRDGQCSDIVARLEKRRFVGVVGTSGSGKSSLVRAGLLPMLEGGFMASAGSFWRFAVMRPGVDALRNLATALADPAVLGGEAIAPALRTPLVEAVLRRSALGLIDAYKQARLAPNENLLVVVDQFEELFRFRQAGRSADAADEGAAFVNLLLEAGRQRELPIHVVLTMRSDFLGDCARFRDLPEMLNDGQYLIPRLTRDQKRATIEGPIAVSGATIAPRLTQRLLNDAGEDPDALPVMQHALMRTWDAWKAAGTPTQPIDLPHYLAIGGMAQGLSQHADQAYAGLAATPGAQAAAQSLFRGLCERGADYRETRRPSTLADLCAAAGADAELMTQVIDAFRRDGRTFIMPGWPTPLQADTMIDISHESLIRQWQMLRDWVQAEARSAALYQRLRQTAQLWPQNAALWRNPDLERALLWEREEAPTAAWATRYGTSDEFSRALEFLRASEAAWRDEAARAARAEREAAEQEFKLRTQQDREALLRAEVRELQSRKRLLQAVLVLVPALIAGLGWAVYNRNQVARQADIAREEAARALVQEKAAQQARAEAQQAAELARSEARRAQEARDESVRLLERLTNTNRLKQAFLTGDVATIQSAVETAPMGPPLSFATRRNTMGWKTPDGKPIYRWDLIPSAESLPGLLRSATQISYYMNHPTFNIKLLSAGAGSGFTASYNGWGCLSTVYVLIEYFDPDTPPRVMQFDQCDALP